jgi:predicted dehydrogenase
MRAPNTRLLLVGVGRMGRNHLRVLRETAGFDLVAVVDAKAEAPSDLEGDVCELRGSTVRPTTAETPRRRGHGHRELERAATAARVVDRMRLRP